MLRGLAVWRLLSGVKARVGSQHVLFVWCCKRRCHQGAWPGCKGPAAVQKL